LFRPKNDRVLQPFIFFARKQTKIIFSRPLNIINENVCVKVLPGCSYTQSAK